MNGYCAKHGRPILTTAGRCELCIIAADIPTTTELNSAARKGETGMNHQDELDRIVELEQELAQTKEQLAAKEARIIELRDSLYAMSHYPEAYSSLAEIALNILSRPDEMSALGKHEAKVLEEAATEFDKTSYLGDCGGFNFANALRRMAKERRRKC